MSDSCFNCKWHDIVEFREREYDVCMIHGAHEHHVDMCPHVPCEDWEEDEENG